MLLDSVVSCYIQQAAMVFWPVCSLAYDEKTTAVNTQVLKKSSTLTESSFLFDPCLIHKGIAML